jgi:hypothetical protein
VLSNRLELGSFQIAVNLQDAPLKTSHLVALFRTFPSHSGLFRPLFKEMPLAL